MWLSQKRLSIPPKTLAFRKNLLSVLYSEKTPFPGDFLLSRDSSIIFQANKFARKINSWLTWLKMP